MSVLTDDQIGFFDENGYLVLEDVVDRTRILAPLIEEYEALLHGLVAGWVAKGRLDACVLDQSFGDKLVSAYASGCNFFSPMDISLPLGGIRADTPMHTGPAVFDLLTCEGLLDVAEALLGPEITSCPIQHVRMKPRQDRLVGEIANSHIVATQWHQDRAVGRAEADGVNVLTTWVAVSEADEENGCLMVVPGSHRGELLEHCPIPQLGIPETLFDRSDVRPMPVGPGGVVLFHPMTIHGSLPNRSDRMRWSFDLRYSRTGEISGRPQFPGFVARSRSAPETELRDAEKWAGLWAKARARLAATEDVGYFHRWTGDAPICA
ncbi:phytanoyl-CoA dioxygenase family protein [hydrothermal vent metagenome]|uniref:Phytanoyl-CoA dioxygenase family protein n=1 Tax=hydrothermal vent metagenome TaxID=652676 RepID=A0A3B0TG42_9ZZZZ